MKPVLFVSDLHLDAAWPPITELFLGFLAAEARQARALYVLGDLFEAWIGDDDLTTHNRAVVDGLRAVAASGVAVALMHGNRDFLLGEGFTQATGCALIPDPSVVEIDGERVLLMHGDSLCIDDVQYQAFRSLSRSAAWQQGMLAKPLEERRAIARGLRDQSEANKRLKAQDIMDVSQGEVERVMRAHGVTRLIHGHTHRPGVHAFDLDGRAAQRIVLGDWQPGRGSVLTYQGGAWQLRELVPGP
jgi:UDP-2,3-diacylglucosamine hydrolase